MTEQDIIDIELRLGRLSPRPWSIVECNRCDTLHIRDGGYDEDSCRGANHASADDRVFINHAPEDVRRLIDEVRALRLLAARVCKAWRAGDLKATADAIGALGWVGPIGWPAETLKANGEIP